MRAAIVGSRSLVDATLVTHQLDLIFSDIDRQRTTVVSGGAKGIDTIARKYAEAYKMDFILFKPYHLVDTQAQYSPKYFFVRNKQIVDNCDTLIAFWDGESNGTKHAIDYATKRNKEVIIVKIEEEDEDV